MIDTQILNLHLNQTFWKCAYPFLPLLVEKDRIVYLRKVLRKRKELEKELKKELDSEIEDSEF